MKRKASAVWQGDLQTGKGTVSSDSGVLSKTPYSFTSRFKDGSGTNPEELIAAAHAGCFTMAFSVQLGAAGFTPDKLETTATLSFEKIGDDWTVTGIHLDTRGRVPGADAEAFAMAATAAKNGCPISRLLKANITMDARLEA